MVGDWIWEGKQLRDRLSLELRKSKDGMRLIEKEFLASVVNS